MRAQKLPRLAAGIAVCFTLVATTSCSNTQQTKSAKVATPSEHALKQKQDAAIAKTQELADLQRKLKETQLKRDNAQKQIPVVLGQSDTAFALAKQYKTNASKTKNPMSKKDLLVKSEKAQKLADDKAAELLTLRKVLYDEHPRIIAMRKQIAETSKAKAEALKQAKAESNRMNKTKLAGNKADQKNL